MARPLMGAPPDENEEDTGTEIDESAIALGGESTEGEGEPIAGEQEPPVDPSAGETVVCTIVMTSDGEYKLYHGDEPEIGGGLEGGEGEYGTPVNAGEGEEGEAPVGEAGGEEGAPLMEGEGAIGDSPEGTVYTSIGDLLKGVLDCIKSHDSESGGASDDESFSQGFKGESNGLAPIVGV